MLNSRLSVPAWFVIAAGLLISAVQAEDSAPGDALLNEYFRQRTAELSERCVADVKTASDWTAQRDARRTELQKMLGLFPWPERTPLKPVVTGTLERDDFVVEKLHFQSRPGLYVTGNLYRPRQITGRLPAILYLCGHATMKDKTVSFGNKTGYQHHGAWFARNGYVCLMIDTIQLGEIEGIHHGTYKYDMWWWHNRGYTPAGVEAWNGIRALDYLQSRADIDPEKIGVTGRSGGGAYTWYVTALDDRVKAAAPVAGITNLQNHIVDGCITGHCDCMFMVNREGWDFPLLAALVAPRPLLIVNTDSDSIFPLDGVVDVFTRTRRIYDLLGAGKDIGLVIGPGGHQDTQALQNAAFSWFNKYLKNDSAPITLVAEKMFKPAELKVFDKLPEDERVTTVQEWFVPSQPDQSAAKSAYVPSRVGLRSVNDLDVHLVRTVERDQYRLREFEFASEDPYRLTFLVVDGSESKEPITVTVLTPEEWDAKSAAIERFFRHAASTDAFSDFFPSAGTQVFIAPRGAGKTRWTADAKAETHIRRRFALLGTTEDERRIIDLANALNAVPLALNQPNAELLVSAQKVSAGWALHAALLLDHPLQWRLLNMGIREADGPYILGISRETALPAMLLQAAESGHRIELDSTTEADAKFWQWLKALAREREIYTLTVKP
ncbi:alpha/beta hydrolase family protein [Planctomicrobium piriforme]|uniref:Acetyl xylan esterase (AXE1) n=1 Tax=Planctomicrobium piriforme TaxID=1576369 RepID=A0A1I3E326_9PLAN|nr:alpha/beta hydrolase family protein [Planctomicrobium piriforme]SFH93397.1 Acetyl xylan esterase (AXE1) [Planctomicrobium piriforme]